MALIACLGLQEGFVVAAPANDAPAFLGHAAEMAMRDPSAEKRHRALFFEAVDVEIGPPWLACDHVAAAKPEAVAGTGHVVLVSALAERAVTIRLWFPPGMATSLADAEAKALSVVGARMPGARIAPSAARAFAWCR